MLLSCLGVSSAQPSVPDTRILTNVRGNSIEVVIQEYDMETGTVSGVLTNGQPFSVSMENLNLGSKLAVYLSQPGVLAIQQWKEPWDTAAPTLAVIHVVSLIVSFVGYVPGAFLVSGIGALWIHLRGYLGIIAVNLVGGIANYLITGGAQPVGMGVLGACGVLLLVFIFMIILLNKNYALDHWYSGIGLLIASAITQSMVWGILIGGVCLLNYYAVLDVNGLVTEWILKPLELM